MKPIDIIIVIFVVAIVGVLVYNAVRNIKNKKSMCGCDSCSADCPLRSVGKKQSNKKGD
ncbi:MAG: FeoB-associated Cys-rich membrane protein [Firmicutes bacterium]|nr:FeoB-associated Cys-rich membrane protein [Bacillota bacterium]